MATYGREAFRTLWADVSLPANSNYRWQDLLTSIVFRNTVDEVSHNDLDGLQGGTTAQYYHLTAANYSNVTAWDHGGLNGLADDDHTQYLNTARHDTTARHGSSVVDHGQINGLADDDHTQYLNTTRHDTTTRHGTSVVDHGSIGGLADDDHTQYVDTAGSRTWALPQPTTDGLYRGIVITGTAGENCTYGDLVYLKSDGKFWMTDADAESTAGGLLLALVASATISANATGNYLLWGTFCETDWAWTVGSALYVSTAAGDMTHTRPSGTADIVRAVGYAYHADAIFFRPSQAWVTIV